MKKWIRFFCLFSISIHYSLCNFCHMQTCQTANISITYMYFFRRFIIVQCLCSFCIFFYVQCLFVGFILPYFEKNYFGQIGLFVVCVQCTFSHVDNNLQWLLFIRLTFICVHKIFIPFYG